MRNALVPQVTGLAMSLGGIFNGADHHRAGVRLSRHRHAAGRCRHAGDYSLVLGVTTVSIVGRVGRRAADRPRSIRCSIRA